MLRKLLDRIDPTRGLPTPMRRYLGLPNRLLLGWLVLTLLIPVAAAQLQRWGVIDLAPSPPESAAETTAALPDNEPVSADSGAEASIALAEAGDATGTNEPQQTPPLLEDGAEITVGGATPFTLRNSGGRITLAIPGWGPLELSGDADDWQLRDGAGQVVYRLKRKSEEKGKIYDAAGSYRFRLKCETEDGQEACKLYDPAGNRLSRVKIKDDSFNVYGAGEDRLYKGKLKNGVYEIRDDAKRSVATIRGVGTLQQAALLALPAEIPVRVLLWRHAGR